MSALSFFVDADYSLNVDEISGNWRAGRCVVAMSCVSQGLSQEALRATIPVTGSN